MARKLVVATLLVFSVSCSQYTAGGGGSGSDGGGNTPDLEDGGTLGDGGWLDGEDAGPNTPGRDASSGPVCTPKTCADFGVECGPTGDGCGGVIECGSCIGPQTCGGGGVPSKCGGEQGCVPKTCASEGASCGPVGDGCGNLLDCGPCTAPQTCGGGGVPNVCGGTQGCVPRTCASEGASCGPVGDGCGKLLDCGSCSLPQTCGGGGVPNVCGGTFSADGGAYCIPKTCAELNLNCGPAGDGCGGVLDCGSCQDGKQCGGGGVTGQCGGTACQPKTCASLGLSCGPAGDGCGGTLECGTCTAPETCGGGGIAGRCGKPACVPRTCEQLGFDCGPAGDGCGGLIQCGTCTAPEICGGFGHPGVCGYEDLSCTNLCQHQVDCGSGSPTTITGRVVAGTDPSQGYGQPDPIYNAKVYVPNAPLEPFPAGVSCDQCVTASGSPLVDATTAYDGTFTLTNVPAGVPFTVVIQLGRWRREIPMAPVTACTTAARGDLRMPRNKSEGDIPLMAISTGSVDPIECVLRKMGIEDSEFTDPGGNGRVRMYRDTGARRTSGTPSASSLYGSASELAKYDMVLFACVASHSAKGTADKQRVIDYANAGGRVYATHYSYVWLYDILPWSGTALWDVRSSNFGNSAKTVTVNTSFSKGEAFAQWLKHVGASTTQGQVSIEALRDNVDDVYGTTQKWIDIANTASSTGRSTVHLTFNTPVGGNAANQCGRVLFSDFHVNTGSSSGTTFPAACAKEPLTAQEKVLEFMLFDLASCIVPDEPIPPSCTPRTCAQAGYNCGPAGDGCGGQLNCGTCTAPQICGGGGKPGVCGPSCTPKTCAQLGLKCGSVSDGCGGTLQCGTCAAPQTCGGAGVAGECGRPSCTPKTCQAQGFECGPAGDGCGGLLDCGNCPAPQFCGGGVGPGKCGTGDNCTPRTCAQQGLSCGPAGDGCGGLLDCGDCAEPLTCGGGGTLGVCGKANCVPRTCAQQGYACGLTGDGCGGQLDCGSCVAPQICGAHGVPGQCGVANCTPTTCAELRFECGPAGDGCGGLLQCGECRVPGTCGLTSPGRCPAGPN